MEQNFKKGDIVTVINSTMSGKTIIEGKASIVKPTGLSDDHYTVRFVNAPEDTYDRFINPAAQHNPQAFVDSLNASLQSGVLTAAKFARAVSIMSALDIGKV